MIKRPAAQRSRRDHQPRVTSDRNPNLIEFRTTLRTQPSYRATRTVPPIWTLTCLPGQPTGRRPGPADLCGRAVWVSMVWSRGRR
jgi:hypothetical protein